MNPSGRLRWLAQQQKQVDCHSLAYCNLKQQSCKPGIGTVEYHPWSAAAATVTEAITGAGNTSGSGSSGDTCGNTC